MNSTLRNMLKGAVLLALFAGIGTFVLSGTFQLTKNEIAEQEKKALITNLNTVLPAQYYNNNIVDDWIRVVDYEAFQNNEPVIIYRARNNGEPSGLVLTATAHDGYSGNIRLIIGLLNDGTITGVRVLSHKETPGLGDKIELAKADWILSFNQHSLNTLKETQWAVKKDGGEFDQFTGATITPRAIVKTIKRTLDFYKARQDALFSQDSFGQESSPN